MLQYKNLSAKNKYNDCSKAQQNFEKEKKW
jgi:hypothetical protein